jgi:integrase
MKLDSTLNYDHQPPPWLASTLEKLDIRIPQPERDLLPRWERLFHDWLMTRKGVQKPCITAWRRLLTFTLLPPWSIDRPLLESWLASMKDEGLTPRTVSRYLNLVRQFYDYVIHSAQDAAIALEENPTQGLHVKRTEVRYASAIWLCDEEVEALLAAVDHRTSLIGARDYALLLCYLTTAQHRSQVRNLRWRAVETLDDAAWVFWKRGMRFRRERLPDQAWNALRTYLEASGRWGHLAEDDYIFAPLKRPGKTPTGLAEQWDPSSPLTNGALARILPMYVSWAELAVSRLTYSDLRHTAVMHQLRSGATVANIHQWLGLDRLDKTRAYIQALESKTISAKRRAAARIIQHKGPLQRSEPGLPPTRAFDLTPNYYNTILSEPNAGDRGPRPYDLAKAISQYRGIVERVLAQADQAVGLDEQLRLLDLGGKALSRLADLENKQQHLADNEFPAAVSQALLEIAEELNLS